jgi:hypothetical protein
MVVVLSIEDVITVIYILQKGVDHTHQLCILQKW